MPHTDIDPSGLEPLPAPTPDELITIETEELSGLCPVEYEDGHDVRDYYTVTIAFMPNQEEPISVELKSLKLYFEQYQDVPISHEHVAETLYGHLQGLLNPEYLYVRNEPNIRGGITTTVELGRLPHGEVSSVKHSITGR